MDKDYLDLCSPEEPPETLFQLFQNEVTLQHQSPTLDLGRDGVILCLVLICLALPANIAALILTIR